MCILQLSSPRAVSDREKEHKGPLKISRKWVPCVNIKARLTTASLITIVSFPMKHRFVCNHFLMSIHNLTVL